MRDISKLHPELQTKIKQLIAECEKQKIKIKVTECVRTKAEQDELYAKGRTKAGSIVTNVQYPNSMHCWGVAFDIILDMDIDGDGQTSDDIYNNKNKTFNKVGSIGKKLGLEWGGDWKSIVDLPHFQLSQWGSTPTRLKNQYGTPEEFFKTWKVSNNDTVSNEDSTYSGTFPKGTLKKGSEGTEVKRLQKFLNWYSDYSLSTDGNFGTKTDKALKDFQKKEDLTVDGVWGSKSLAKARTIKK